jgi:hypothetical protein
MRAEDRTNDEVTGMPDTKNGPKESLSVGAQSIATAPDDATVIEAPNNNKAAVFFMLASCSLLQQDNTDCDQANVFVNNTPQA